MKLTPVIEFGPELFRKESRDFPSFELKGAAYNKAYREFWTAMLADWGIVDLKPYLEGSEFVAVSDINNQALGVLIDRALDAGEFAEAGLEDYVSTFCGGIVFEDDSHAIEPSCCGDLSNFSEWQDLSVLPVGDVKEVWIGHPWIDVEGLDSDRMRLHMRCEHSSKLLVDSVISQFELSQHVAKTVGELSAFNDRVKAELTRKSYPSELAYVLTGLTKKEAK